MKTNYLISNKFKPFGWVLFVLGIIAGIFLYIAEYESDALTIKVLSVYSESFIGNDKSFFQITENSILDELIALAIIHL